MKFTEAQSKSIHKEAEREEDEASGYCKHDLEKGKCEECSKNYHESEESSKEEGDEEEKESKEQVDERVKDLKEDKKTIPVFMRGKKGLRYSHTKEEK